MVLNRKRKNNDISADDSSNIQPKVNKFSYVFSIQNFSLRTEKTGEKITSLNFFTGWKNKSQWNLSIYPNGQSEDSKEYVSVFLTLIKPDKAKAKYKFSILNEKEEEKNVINNGITKDFVKNEGWGFSKFVKKDFLLDVSNGLLINDKLTILCEAEATTFRSDNQNNLDTSKNITIPQSTLLSNYADMFDSSLFTDFIIKVGDTEIKVHKAVLAARSPVFHNILSSPLEESQTNAIKIEDFRVEVVREMLNYIYKEKISNIQNMADEMFEIANKYELHRLKAISEQSLCNNLAIENVCERFALSEKYSIESLKKCCIELILENVRWLTKTKEWKQFVLVHPSLVESLFLKAINISSIECI
uniref:Speckle-type POZ protein-like (inferred by orthology to a human protein) n=1 Tax=Strongyloides papillosus TaxID=174720 RepID=A0A0N5C047_STREA